MAINQKKLPELEVQGEAQWDIKRIFVGIVVLAVLFILGSYFFVITGEKVIQKTQTLGVQNQAQKVPEFPTQEDAVKLLNEAQKSLSQITSDNLVSSDAAITRIISNLQALQGGKKTAADVFCELVCKK